MAIEKKSSFKNPLKFIIRTTLFLIVLVFSAYLIFKLLSEFDTANSGSYEIISKEIKTFGLSIFMFIKPFLQLAVILIIIEWILGKLGIRKGSSLLNLEWNIQTIIGLIIISGFVIAALGDLSGVTYLKDIALVVVGFYFGSQRRIVEYDSKGNKIKVFEEHDNKINIDKNPTENK